MTVEQIDNNRYAFAIADIGENNQMYYEAYKPELNQYQKSDIPRFPCVFARVEECFIDRTTKREGYLIWLALTDIISASRAGITEQHDLSKSVICEIIEGIRRYDFSCTDQSVTFIPQTYTLPSFAQILSCNLNIISLI